MKALGAALLFVAASCASGGSNQPPFEQPDAPAHLPDAPEEVFPESPTVTPDAPPMVTPDAAPDAPPDACVPSQQEKLQNPALDLAPIGTMWTQVPATNVSGGPFALIISSANGALTTSLPNAIWLGGVSSSDANLAIDEVFQDITFPADATSFVISGSVAVASQDDPATVFDAFSLDLVDPANPATVIENIVQVNNTTAPQSQYITFNKVLTSNLAGRTVRFSAISGNDDLFPTSFFLDGLSFKATFCP